MLLMLKQLHSEYSFDAIYSHQETGNLATYRRLLSLGRGCESSLA